MSTASLSTARDRFKPPPLDGSLTIPEIYAWHAEFNPEYPVFVFPETDGAVTVHTYSDVIAAATRGAHYIADCANIGIGTSYQGTRPVVVLAASVSPMQHAS
ncbi:uncharacterized protein B0H18DRAFT_1115056 [Fomitopsis serialis]|uniref:uncharacterized protein n=1 Tax=Fomitopsis serialis TaxID=139415 RepID=UPI002007FC83|nr:uncharacterized protein B0H18DRAFT_1115056 [Neoantrodia serialis]KAH9934337.1 hypothetical protein B0H18DRAFT_1115056 [Neoantrodia serialis]